MSEDESKELVDLWQKVKAVTNAGLTDADRELLHAGLFLAWILTTRVSELEKGFQGSFTPDQVEVLKEYGPAASASVHFAPHLVPHFTGESIRSGLHNSIRSHTTP